jgi:hypothetical protein
MINIRTLLSLGYDETRTLLTDTSGQRLDKLTCGIVAGISLLKAVWAAATASNAKFEGSAT